MFGEEEGEETQGKLGSSESCASAYQSVYINVRPDS